MWNARWLVLASSRCDSRLAVWLRKIRNAFVMVACQICVALHILLMSRSSTSLQGIIGNSLATLSKLTAFDVMIRIFTLEFRTNEICDFLAPTNSPKVATSITSSYGSKKITFKTPSSFEQAEEVNGCSRGVDPHRVKQRNVYLGVIVRAVSILSGSVPHQKKNSNGKIESSCW